MIDWIKYFLKRLFPDQINGYRLYRDFVLNKSSYLQKTGWIRSIETGKPVDQADNPVPWINYSMISLLRQRIPSNAYVFEYGSGYSTLFLANLVQSVTSLESDKDWIERIRPLLPNNAKVCFCPADINGDYCRYISKIENLWNIVLIDGRDRVNCIKQALNFLSANGVIILDDSQRVKYRPAFQLLSETGFRALTIEGVKPTDSLIHEATIFYRNDNCLGL